LIFKREVVNYLAHEEYNLKIDYSNYPSEFSKWSLDLIKYCLRQYENRPFINEEFISKLET